MVAQRNAATLVSDMGPSGLGSSSDVDYNFASQPLSWVDQQQQEQQQQQQQQQQQWSWHFPALSSLTMNLLSEADGNQLWGLGIGLMIIGCVCSSLGMLCFKRAGNDSDNRPWYRDPWFWSGMTLFVAVALILDTLVFAITPLGLIAPFAGLTIVVSFFLASFGCFGIKEPATKTATVAVVLIVMGVTICSLTGPKGDGKLTPQELQAAFNKYPWLFVICGAGGPSFIIFYTVSVYRAEQTKKALRSWQGALVLALSAAVFGAVTQLQFKSLAAAVVQILQNSTNKAGGFQSAASGIYTNSAMVVEQLLCVISTGLAQIGYLNFAISAAPVAYTVPAYQVRLVRRPTKQPAAARSPSACICSPVCGRPTRDCMRDRMRDRMRDCAPALCCG